MKTVINGCNYSRISIATLEYLAEKSMRNDEKSGLDHMSDIRTTFIEIIYAICKCTEPVGTVSAIGRKLAMQLQFT